MILLPARTSLGLKMNKFVFVVSALWWLDTASSAKGGAAQSSGDVFMSSSEMNKVFQLEQQLVRQIVLLRFLARA